VKVLALVTDAYGGTGGIAKYNRDFLESVASHAAVESVVVVPRVIAREHEQLPRNLAQRDEAAGSKIRYLRSLSAITSQGADFGVVICGHINLLPLAWLAARRCKAPLVLIVYGVEVWTKGSPVQRYLLKKVAGIVAISAFTVQRLREWADVQGDRIFLIPNAIDLDAFTPGPANERLRQRLSLGTGPVLLTLGRMAASERAKGFDEVLEILPVLLEDYPTLTYCAAGDGTDRARLEEKARRLGVWERTVFTGYVPESEKLDLYRLADLFVMPSRLEGFGYVFLEALASGIPVVASSIDGSREAVRAGAWGSLANPNNRDEILNSIRSSLRNPKIPPRDELEYLSTARFRGRVWKVLENVARTGGSAD
jgi:glycosyltransferase involved in cell wall biosynthesis